MKKIMSIISILLSIILIVLLVLLNIIPNKYLFMIIGSLFISNLISILLIFRKNKFLKVIGYLFISIVIIGSLIGIYYTGNTTKLFNSIREVKEKNIYYVVVNKDSEYDKLENLKDKKIGTIKSDSTNYKKALKDIEKTIKISNKDYESTLTLFNDVIDNKIDNILISSNNYEIACESNENIKNNTKVIYQVSIEVIKEKEKEYNNSKGTMNILISGIDTNGDINNVSRSDVNIIVTVNPNTHEVLLTNIPRDMEVQLHGTTGTTDKLTHAGIYGVDMTRKTLEDFLETDIEYYVRVNFDSVVEIVDKIGGVDIYNDKNFSTGKYYFKEGNIHLNGDQALAYSRDRYHQDSGDWSRGQHQMEIIKAIINKVTHSTELLTNYNEIIESLSKFVQTNIPDKEIKKYVKNQLNDMPTWNTYTYAVSGSGYSYQETYSMPGMDLYVTHKEEASRAYASRLINGMLNGKTKESVQ